MKYICLIYSAQDAGPQPGTPEFGALIGAYQEFSKEVGEKGILLGGDALQPVHLLNQIEEVDSLGDYQPFHAAKAEVLLNLKQVDLAKWHLRKAVDLSDNVAERGFLQKRLDAC